MEAAEGSIWVWAQYEDHYEMRKPFASLDESFASLDEEAAEAVGKLFRNAQLNSLSLCSDEYLYGCPGAFSGTPSDPYMYWSGGIDVYFRKVDSEEVLDGGKPLGNPLAGAVFALYGEADYDKALSGSEEGRIEVTAGDDTATVFVSTESFLEADLRIGGSTVKYLYNVTFSVSPGVYYMKEVIPPAGYRPNPYVYRVIVGEAKAKELLGASEAARLMNGVEYLIQRMSSDSAADETPDIFRYGIVNLPLAERKVILKNVDKAWQPLTGGTFDILCWDLSPYWYYVKDGEGKDQLVLTTGCIAGDAGAFWTGRLPFGDYYLHRTDSNQWYKVTIEKDSRQAEATPCGAPTVTGG
jgi:hypothetical protein